MTIYETLLQALAVVDTLKMPQAQIMLYEAEKMNYLRTFPHAINMLSCCTPRSPPQPSKTLETNPETHNQPPNPHRMPDI